MYKLAICYDEEGGATIIYKTIIIPVKCSKEDYSYLMQCNLISGEVWNRCVELDKEFHKQSNRYMKMSEMQTALKGFSMLHRKGVYHVYRKYLTARNAMFQSIKAKHENSENVKLPYKNKKYFNTGWDYQSIRVDYDAGIIKLARRNLKKSVE